MIFSILIFVERLGKLTPKESPPIPPLLWVYCLPSLSIKVTVRKITFPSLNFIPPLLLTQPKEQFSHGRKHTVALLRVRNKGVGHFIVNGMVVKVISLFKITTSSTLRNKQEPENAENVTSNSNLRDLTYLLELFFMSPSQVNYGNLSTSRPMAPAGTHDGTFAFPKGLGFPAS